MACSRPSAEGQRCALTWLLGASLRRPLAALGTAVISGSAQAMGAELAGVDVHMDASAKPPERAAGDGCGCLLVASTSSGCLLGSSGTGGRSQECVAVPPRPGRLLS